MRQFALGLIIGLLFVSGSVFATELIEDFQRSLTVETLNEELRQLNSRLDLLEGRVTDLE